MARPFNAILGIRTVANHDAPRVWYPCSGQDMKIRKGSLKAPAVKITDDVIGHEQGLGGKMYALNIHAHSGELE